MYFFVTFTIILFSKEIISLLDESYSDSLMVVIIILLSYLLNGLKLLFQVTMDFNIKYIKIKSLLWMISAFSNILLNIWLIPKYSYNGAAYATFISYMIIFIPVLIFSNRAIKIKYPIKKMLQILFLSLAILPFYRLNLSFINILIKILILGFYFVILSKIIDTNLTNILKTIKRRR